MNRQEHMAWCKQRALEYLSQGDIQESITSMLSDLGKHDGTKGVGVLLAGRGMSIILNGGAAEARRFITGFN